jgi:hypothetical protein
MSERPEPPDEFYIVDLRSVWKRNPYITFWRPRDAGYAYPLPWAGRYTKANVDEGGRYYYGSKDHKTRIDRFPVRCDVVERYGVQPAPGHIDGDAGPVVPNTKEIRQALKAARYRPQTIQGESR